MPIGTNVEQTTVYCSFKQNNRGLSPISSSLNMPSLCLVSCELINIAGISKNKKITSCMNLYEFGLDHGLKLEPTPQIAREIKRERSGPSTGGSILNRHHNMLWQKIR